MIHAVNLLLKVSGKVVGRQTGADHYQITDHNLELEDANSNDLVCAVWS